MCTQAVHASLMPMSYTFTCTYLAFLVISDSVLILHPAMTGMAHAAIGCMVVERGTHLKHTHIKIVHKWIDMLMVHYSSKYFIQLPINQTHTHTHTHMHMHTHTHTHVHTHV